MKIDFKERTIYCKINYNHNADKKVLWFGKDGWGSLDKSEANASAIRTGDGLVVVDVDTKNLKEIDKKLRNFLKEFKPTVETARGFHYYFVDKKSEEFTSKSAYTTHVDIRSDGGIILNQYLGKEKPKYISYKKVGDVCGKIPKPMRKYLMSLKQNSKVKMKNRSQWEEVESGEIHDTCIRYAMRDFNNGLSYDEVIANGLDYVQKYLNNSPREIKLMLDRLKWAYETKAQERFENSKPEAIVEPLDIGGELEDAEILLMLQKAQKGGALELERVMGEIKKKLKISKTTLKEMLKESPEDVEGLDSLFKGSVVWASNLGVFAEVFKGDIFYYNKNNFVQTCISKSGWMNSSDVNERLSSIPSKILEYDPTSENDSGFDNFGNSTINSYHGVVFKSENVTKIPKTIDKVLDNLFSEDVKAKTYFLSWLAYIVQTGKRTGIAWGFFGASGSGKGLIVDIISKMLGNQNCSLNIGDNALQSTFNSYLHNKQFIHLNEIASDFHGRHGVAGKTKSMISDPIIHINPKNMPAVFVKNFTNTILNSNKSNPIEIDKDDRRWNMIITMTSLSSLKWWKGDKSYQKAVKEFDAFGVYLSNYKFDINKATRPMEISTVKRSIIEQTTNTFDLVGEAITGKNSDLLLDILDLDESDFYITESEIVESCANGLWSNNLLNRIYKHLNGDKSVKPYDYKKYFIKPFIKKYKLLVFKQNGLSIRGLKIKV